MVFSVGDVYNLSPIIATLYAIVSKVQTYNLERKQFSKEESFNDNSKLNVSKSSITSAEQSLIIPADFFSDNEYSKIS